MLQLTGMDVAKIIRETNDTSEIIFITSIVDYIQEGYKVRAYRYLLKPIDFGDLNESILSCISDIIKKRKFYADRK
ncbi:response regulator [Clostridioides difficile]|nr:response regulator [Clostridioides difficile]MBT2158960.1 response regulator [Clostridioides difficile]